jgi:hypothetical protein
MISTQRNLQRVSVITQGGKLVGVYVPPAPGTDPRAPIARVVAGPKQQVFELQVEVPAVLKRGKDIDAFHAIVRKQLKRRRVRK